jgi:two-component system cell cycle sensor histidine kinase/response regulator CckA
MAISVVSFDPRTGSSSFPERLWRLFRPVTTIAAVASACAALWVIVRAGDPASALLPAIAFAVGIGAAVYGRRRKLASEAMFLAQALDRDPRAVAIVTADRDRDLFVNLAFDRRFAPSRRPPLARIETALADDERSQAEFARLCQAAAAGREAEASLLLRRSDAATPGHSLVTVAPLAGRRECCLWSVAEPASAAGPGGAEDEDDFRRLFDNAPVGIALVDCDGRFTAANRALGQLFDAAPAELIGAELVGFLEEADRADIAARIGLGAQRQRGSRAPIEIRLAHPRERIMVLFVSPLDEDDRGEAGRSRLALHFIDVTDRKALETQFAQSAKMQAVGQLAGGVAHDFNNLLTAMIGFCDLLLLRCRPGDPSFADIMQIKQNANRAANLVRQLLAFARRQTLQPRVLDITDALVELSHLLRRLIGENIELKVVHGRDLGLVKVDESQLEQVIINLAVNARDAMPGGGTLTIRTANRHQPVDLRRGIEIMPAGDYVVIEVADTGVGIAKDDLARIFDPFFSTKEAGSGTGLGLSMVDGIVKQTGGFIFVDSVPGQGASFEICLPRYRPAPGEWPMRAEPIEPPVAADLTGMDTILFVEDDDPVRTFGARALRNRGYRVVEAKGGEAALTLIREGTSRIDLLITDVAMPQMDGPSLVRELRQIQPDIKVIFISGYAEDSFRQRLGGDENIHFLPKPFNLKQLTIKVKDVVSGVPA